VSAVAELATGASHTCARHEDGQVTCWGLAEAIVAGGAAVLPPTPMGSIQNPRALAAGVNLSCAVTEASQIRCWGNRPGTILREAGEPLTGVDRVLVGNGFGCASHADGIFCWGQNDFGQLARPLDQGGSAVALLALPGRRTHLGVGIAVVAHDGSSALCAWGRNATKMITSADAVDVYTEPQCRPVPDVQELAVGDTHACVRHGDGRFTCWGERYYGQLGIGGTGTADIAPPGSPTSLPAAVTTLAAGVSHTCVLLADGRVSCFGRNQAGQVGPDPGTPEEEVRQPVFVTGLPAKVVGLASGSSSHHTCAIVGDGSVWCWGANHAGQLGAGALSVEPTRSSALPLEVGF